MKMNKTIQLSQVQLGDRLIMRGKSKKSDFVFEGIVILRDKKLFLKDLTNNDKGWYLEPDQQKYWTLELVE